MGCSSSKDVMHKIQEQEKKIDDLLEINKALEDRLNELNAGGENGIKRGADYVIKLEIIMLKQQQDLATLKSNIDQRFSKLEKTVEKIHHEFRLRLFDGIVDNLDDPHDPNAPRDKSLTLNFEREKGGAEKKPPNDGANAQWNDLIQLLYDSQIQGGKFEKGDYDGAVNHEDIKMEFNGKIDYKNPNANTNGEERRSNKATLSTNNVRDLLQDDQMKKIYSEVKKTMFKKSQN